MRRVKELKTRASVEHGGVNNRQEFSKGKDHRVA